MTAAPVAIRQPNVDGYTTVDLHALPEDGRRWELIDGSLTVSPSATTDHNTIALWIANALWDTNPSNEFVVGLDQSATIDRHNEPRPDVIVASAEFFQQSPFPMTSAQLVVEVVSPSTRKRDRLEKPADYAAAGIPHFWRIEQDPLHVFAYDLVGGGYELVADSTEELVLTAPFEIKLPIRDITP